MKIPSEQLLQRRFPVFTAVAIFICFVLFPLFLVNSVFDRILAIQADNRLEKEEQKLEQALDFIESCSDDSHFAHMLFSKAFNTANNSPTPVKQLSQQISRLKTKFPGIFLFIAWDKKGAVLKDLTDEKSYAYMLRETYKLLSEIDQHCKAYVPANFQTIPLLEKRLKILRHYLGRLIPLKMLNMPLQPGKLASTILSEPEGEKSHIWYAIGKEVSLLCFIHSDFFKNRVGINSALGRLSRISPDMEAGIAGYPILEENILTRASTTAKSEIVLAIGKFENLHPGNILIHNNRIFAYRLLNQKQRAYCSLPIHDHEKPANQKARMLAGALKWLLVLIFVGVVYTKKHTTNFVSISIKLAGLFLYAAGIPVLIAMILAADYLHQKKAELVYEHQSRQLKMLRDIDDGFQVFIKKREKALRDLIKEFSGVDESFFSKPQLLGAFTRKINDRLKYDNIMMFDLGGKNQIFEQGGVINDATIFSQLCTESILFMNMQSTRNANLSSLARPLASEMLYNLGKIMVLNFGENQTYAYYERLGNYRNYASKAVLFIFWQIETLQKTYLQETFRKQPNFFAYFPATDSFLNKESMRNTELANLMQKAEKLLVTRSKSLRHKNQNYAAAAMRGANLNFSTLAGIVPLNLINHEIEKLQQKFLFFAGAYLLIALGSAILLRRRLLMPLTEFKTAIESIGQRNFRFKVSIEGQNEFGKLGAALNHTLENLQELEIARIVQDNLLPGHSFTQNQLALHASLSQMSHIGGDYYDFFAVNQHTTGIFIGDVSGHGISSALFMAMARSTLIYESFSEPSQDAILLALNRVILKVRSSGAKEYMTGQAIFINSNDGDFRVINAGHCPPIVIRNNGSWEILSCKGLPLGFKADPKYEPVHGKLDKGDWLIFYTDGWVEAESQDGVAFGFNRFAEALQTCRNENNELFVQKMFATIGQWQAETKDDLTLIVTRFGGHN